MPGAFKAAAAKLAQLTARTRRRMQQVAWSAGLSLALLAGFLLEPIDQFAWLVQSRLAEHRPSGDIIYISSEKDMADAAVPMRREAIAAALDKLDKSGARQVYLAITFPSASVSAADADLNRAIARLGARVALVDRLDFDVAGTPAKVATRPQIGGGAQRVLFVDAPNYLGLFWNAPFTYTVEGKTYRTFAAALGEADAGAEGLFPIDYGFPAKAIPVFKLQDLDRVPASAFAGKTVVIGNGPEAEGARASIPGAKDVPAAFVAIYGAETLKAGRTGFVPAAPLLALVAALTLALVAMSRSRARRRIGYALLVAAMVGGLFAGSAFGVRSEMAYTVAFLLIYGLFRWRNRSQERAALFDPDTGLPTLRALEDWLSRNRAAGGHVVMARIHGYEHVLRTLHSEDHSAYSIRLADRLRAVDRDLAVYATGHYFGWHNASDDVDALVEHLAGLRAIFAAPVQVGPHTVDVGITFGVARVDGDPAGRIAAAIAAVDETSEAIDPVRVASSGSDIDLLWDISLRARIDEAMEAGEIYCVYQPKIDTQAGRMVGVEALVRWHDPAKGFIPPMHFIQQCEKAGRMEHLTRYVLQSACSAGKLLHFRGQDISMSVNISATLLVDMRICGIVRNVLQATGFDARFLILEVTETARITHFPVAATVLQELKSLGCRISMDDFGVGAANYETLFELPFDEIKLDRLFVSNAVESPKARAIVASVVAMGRSARIAVVAEGAETPGDLAMLEELGCTHVQGFALSRPLSLSNLLDFKVIPSVQELKNIV